MEQKAGVGSGIQFKQIEKVDLKADNSEILNREAG